MERPRLCRLALVADRWMMGLSAIALTVSADADAAVGEEELSVAESLPLAVSGLVLLLVGDAMVELAMEEVSSAGVASF